MRTHNFSTDAITSSYPKLNKCLRNKVVHPVHCCFGLCQAFLFHTSYLLYVLLHVVLLLVLVLVLVLLLLLLLGALCSWKVAATFPPLARNKCLGFPMATEPSRKP